MFLLFEALALIETWFGTIYGFRALYTAGMWFCSGFPGCIHRCVERLFKKFSDDGLKFMVGAAIAMIGVGKCRQVLDQLPLFTLDAHLAMMGLCSSILSLPTGLGLSSSQITSLCALDDL
ncbi:hypothetical protein Tco_1298053, partial [Tanacetum coccineum]